MANKENSLVYEVKDIQRLLGVSRSVVYEGLRMKIIPCLRLGRRYVIPKAAFHRWLDESASSSEVARLNSDTSYRLPGS